MEKKLKAERRDDGGKGAARRTRAGGRVPAILYGGGMDAVPLSVDARDLFHILHGEAGGNVLIELSVGDTQHLVLPREIQRDHTKGRYLHLDFLAVRRDEKITVEVPVHIVGESQGVKEGGVVEHHLWQIRAECLPGDVPDAIEADVTDLRIGDSLRVHDLKPPPGVTVLTDLEETVVSVVVPQVLKVEEEVEEAEGEAVEGEEAEAEGEGATGEEAAEHAEAAEEGGEGGEG